MKRLAILAPLALAACQHNQPGIEIRTVEKIVEVQRPCPATAPERPAPLGELPEHAQQALAQALAALAAYSAPGMYADQAEAWFQICGEAD